MFYFDAYTELSSCRNFELGPIPYLAVRQFCEDIGWNEAQFERLLYVIREVDEWKINRELSKVNKKGSGNGKGLA